MGGGTKQLVRGQGPDAVRSLPEPGTCRPGDSGFQRKQKGPSRISAQGPGVQAGYAFSTRNEDSRPSSNFEKKHGGS